MSETMSNAEYHHQYYLEHKEKWLKFRRENSEKHLIANKKSYRRLKELRAPAWNSRRRELRKELREKVLIHYGGNPPKCACCGESKIEFLAIDHVNGGGRKHSASINGHLCEWLRLHAYPAGFRVLCHNCNQAMGIYGYCPHGLK